MQVIETPFSGLFVVQPTVYTDERGYFFESYNFSKLSELIPHTHFIQDNQSLSQSNVLRGLHFQNPPHAQVKLVQVIKGAVLDVVVDIRKKSPTYGKHYKIRLDEKNKTQLWIPHGFAHGFYTLEDNTIFHYKCSELYNKQSEDAIFWNDPDLGIQWEAEDPIISDKDKLAKSFNGFISLF